MKPILRGVLLFTVSTSLLAVVGCRSRPSHAEETVVTPPPPAPVTVVAAVPTPTPPPPAQPAPTPTTPRAPIIITNSNPAPAPTAAPAAIPALDETTAPPTIEVSPALAEVVKLVQGGVGEDVLMAYITNSADIFDLGSEQILYLHDLGVPGHLITALIQQDSTPEALAKKQAAATASTRKPATAPVVPATTTTTQAPAVVYTVPPAEQPVVINQFYTDLAPYGAWIDVAGYGRCWRPTVAIYNTSWRPYCDGGRWVWTDHGWYWYSDYSWGWAPFHYGRWHSHATFGWVWTPDVHWGPAWVSWRRSGDYCAWAPLPPFATFTIGIGWHHRGRRYNDECDFIPHHRYVALPLRHLHAARPAQHLVAARQAEVAVRASSAANTHTAVNRTVINRGVSVEDVAQSSGRPIRPVSLRPTSDAPRVQSRREMLDADGKTLTISRPTPAPTGERPAARPGASTTNPRVNVTRGNGTATSTTPPATSTPVVRDTGTRNPAAPRSVVTRGTTRPAESTVNPPANVGSVSPRPGSVTTRSATPTVVTPPAVTPPSAPTQPRVTRDNSAPPRGGRPPGNSAGENISRPTVVTRPSPTPGQAPAPVVRVPAPAPAPAPMTRTESPRSQTPPPAARPPVFDAPTPRASSPPPSVSSPRPSSPSPAPRVESRSSPPPSRSGGDNTPRVSRSSGDDNGRRNSR